MLLNVNALSIHYYQKVIAVIANIENFSFSIGFYSYLNRQI